MLSHITKKSFYILSSVFLLAGLLTYFDAVPVTSQVQQGMVLVSKKIGIDPTGADVNSQVWSEVVPVVVPLSGQDRVTPRLFTPTVKSVTVRSFNNGQSIAFLMEWDDETQDLSNLRHEDFRDAAAIQFPVSPRGIYGSGAFRCMGQRDAMLNIWHWKADWEEDMSGYKDIEEAHPDMYWDYYPFAQVDQSGNADPASRRISAPKHDKVFLTGWGAGNPLSQPNRGTSVEEMNAGGFGTLTAQTAALVEPKALEKMETRGHGMWQNGKWKLVLSRPLKTGDAEDVQFNAGENIPMAFAIWNGSNQERNGRKAVSTWYYLKVE